MNEDDYPGLYQSANKSSSGAQRAFLSTLGANFACIVLSSVLSTINLPTANFAIFQTIILLVGLVLTIYLAVSKPQQTWYGTRALAESAKTISWRYMMRAEPYNLADEEAQKHFTLSLKKLFSSNRYLSSVSLPVSTAEEITIKMQEVRAGSLEERKSFYTISRIAEQRSWYVSKAAFNRRRARWWLGAIILIYIIMIVFSVARPAYPNVEMWPTDVLLTIAGSLLAWTQTKKYQELAASYALTAHEINLLKAEIPTSADEKNFSNFVGDAENAFSREHTQWQARRDQD